MPTERPRASEVAAMIVAQRTSEKQSTAAAAPLLAVPAKAHVRTHETPPSSERAKRSDAPKR